MVQVQLRDLTGAMVQIDVESSSEMSLVMERASVAFGSIPKQKHKLYFKVAEDNNAKFKSN